MIRLGVVSFLNARPLIEGLASDAGVRCEFDVPARLLGRLEGGEVDAALVPVVDLLRAGERYRVVSDACIGSAGETMTVRVFSRVPPNHVQTLWVDSDSHTSVALATTLWAELFAQGLELRSLDVRAGVPDEAEAVLLIGDKVVDPGRGSFGYEVDLGGAWQQHTGLPFVFAVWAVPSNTDPTLADRLARTLSAARNRGVARAAQIGAEAGPAHGWPVALAQRYLTRCLRFTLDESAWAGVQRFAELCGALDLVPRGARLWPVAGATAEFPSKTS